MKTNPTSNDLSKDQNDEFDLIDFIILLWEGKKIIIFSVIICLIIAFTYLNFAKEKWSSEAVLTRPSAGQIATFNSALNVINSSNLQDKIPLPQIQQQIFDRFSSSINSLSDSLNNRSDPELMKVSQYRSGQDDPLLIKYTSTSAKAAQDKLQRYIDSINSEITSDYVSDLKKTLSVKINELNSASKNFIDVANDRKQHRLDVIKNALLVAKQSETNATQLRQAEYLSDDTLYLLGYKALNAMLENEKSKPINLDDSYYSLQQSLAALNSLKLNLDGFNSYRYVMKPTLAYKRDSPRQVLIIAISLIMGAIIGSMWVIACSIYKKRSTN